MHASKKDGTTAQNKVKMQVLQPSLKIWDYIIVILVLVISSSIGVYYRFTGGKQKTVKEYLHADKNMSIYPVAISLMASFLSSITIIGVSSENYAYGFQFILIYLGHLIFTPIAAYLYLPVFFKLQATSAYEYLELRFGKIARLATSLSYTLQMTLYTGVVIYAPALALEALTGINRVTAVLSVGLVCTFYSTLGGMKAVLMTDVFQAILMFLGVFSIIGSAVVTQGGFANIWRIAQEGNRTNIWNFDPDPTIRHSWLSLILGGGILYLSLYGVNQTQIQRYLTVRDLDRAQKALWLNWPIFCSLGVATSFTGLAIYSKYHACDPVKAGFITSMDQLMPYYVVDTMGHIPGLSGLFVAGIFSASLSTISASLNSVAAVTMEDYYKPLNKYLGKAELTQQSAATLTKFIALVYGIVCLGVAFLVQYLGAILRASLTIFGAVGGPILGLFSLGMFTFVANEQGSLAGLLAGMFVSMWLAFAPKPPLKPLPTTVDECYGKNISTFSTRNSIGLAGTNVLNESDFPWLYRVSYLYNGVIGLAVTFTIGYITSFIIRKISGRKIEDEDYNPNLFVPCLSRKLLENKRENKVFKLIKRSDSHEDMRIV
ncbi:putative sodium-dependent multivitamin transporter isoform X2 [Anthonomus grandis grandis]|uniref:putative sodium-dependent multivitamin transporter isoform X2 n=1 Tax=Anthonomus grandis grandis TaxID=2921223 RepID=UPI00216562A1|nr:putative sodium-dependent multivitamin transporter isoform X2 [Anthonomus grandis grandis]